MPPAALTTDEFTTAFARHGRTLWVVAAAWVGRGEASDLVQETARVAWQNRAQFTPGSDLAAWLCQIVRHTGANWRRKRRPAATDPAELPEPAAPPMRAIATTFSGLRDDLPDALAEKLEQLPEVACASLLLHAVAGHSFAEIATMLDIPENTATSHARRARMFLQKALAAPQAEAR